MKFPVMSSSRAATFAGLFTIAALVFGQNYPPLETQTSPNVGAPVTSVGPFVGDHSETWEEFGAHQIPNGTSILGGIATITGTKMFTSHTFYMCTVYALPSDGS